MTENPLPANQHEPTDPPSFDSSIEEESRKIQMKLNCDHLCTIKGVHFGSRYLQVRYPQIQHVCEDNIPDHLADKWLDIDLLLLSDMISTAARNKKLKVLSDYFSMIEVSKGEEGTFTYMETVSRALYLYRLGEYIKNIVSETLNEHKHFIDRVEKKKTLLIRELSTELS